VNDEWDPDAWGVVQSPVVPSSPPAGASAPAVSNAPEPAADNAQSAPGAPITPGFELRRVQTPSGIQRSNHFGEGSRIGGYLLRECIGQGGMARVYRAEHEGLKRQVAVKVLLEAPNTDGHERFLREARIAAAIKHRNVVNIFDVGVDGGMPYLVMELLEGADLDTFMGGKNRLDEATTMDIIVPITSALSTVHDAGIVHRDLKPGNIFLARGTNDELEPRLLDFGISKSTADQLRLTSTHGPVMGTPFYMSPEAASGTEMTPLSDQYALGVVLYECVTGVNPFAASSNFAEIVRRITSADYDPPQVKNPQLSRRMAAIIERAMQLDPARRFPDLRAMGRELLLLAGQRTRVTWQLSFNDLGRPSLAAAGPPPVLPAPAPIRKRRWLAVAPALALLGLAGAWATGSLHRFGVPGIAPVAARASLADVLSRGSVKAAEQREERPQVTLALEPERAPGEAAASIPAAIVASDPGVDAPIASASPGEGAASEPAATEAPGVKKPASAAPRSTPARRTARRSTKPKPAERAPAPVLELGTNNAPILD
jgi:serine/threonine-protein kinase